MAFANIISPVVLKKYLEFWISEDVPNFDLSSIAVGSQQVFARIEMKEEGVLAGLPFAEAIFKYLDCVVEWRFPEGTFIDKKTTVAEVSGLSSKLLMAERTALNILSRASGVATISRRVQKKIDAKWKGEISGTRKTSPGMRMVEKYAMYVGGITTHRYDISSMIMLKDNHIKINGSIENSVKMIKEKVGSLMMLEVECRSLTEALEAAKSGANVVMLDNFDAKDVESVSKQVKEAHPSVLIEVSGGINENNILAYAVTSVDIISSSIFCQGYKCIDLSLNIVTETTPFKPQIIETVNDTSTNDIEIIALDIIKSTEFDLPETEVTIAPKAGIKRKIDEASEKTVENKIITTPVETPIKQIKKIEEKPVTPAPKVKSPVKIDIKTPVKVDNKAPVKIDNKAPVKVDNKAPVKVDNKAPVKVDNKAPIKLQRPNNNTNKPNNAQYNSKHLAPSRMSGYPLQTNTPRGSNNSNVMNIMSSGFSPPFQNSQPDDAFFRGSTPMRLGPGNARSSLNNLTEPRNFGGQFRSMGNNNNSDNNISFRFFCKGCRFQNPINGPPMCRLCRQMLV